MIYAVVSEIRTKSSARAKKWSAWKLHHGVICDSKEGAKQRLRDERIRDRDYSNRTQEFRSNPYKLTRVGKGK